jgi:hypothetical protein
VKYQFRRGQSIAGTSAEVVGAELEDIRLRNGGKLKPHDVVDAARYEDSPLHPAFEWDDSKAAEAHRLWQARTLIRSVEIIIEAAPEAVPLMVNVRMGGEQYYQSSVVLQNSPDELSAALRDASERLASAKDSLNRLAQLKSMDTKRAVKITKAAEFVGRAADIIGGLREAAV